MSVRRPPPLKRWKARTQGHAWLLRELLINLVDNAIKYTPAQGAVTLRCGQAGDGAAWIEVEDDGPGIAPAERARVLQRFYRVPGTGGSGHGLGLAIADGIARVHRTQLRLDGGAMPLADFRGKVLLLFFWATW